MAYEHLGEGALDYFPCRYGRSKLLFRGPRKNLDRPYIAFLGGTEVYGRYVEQPLPDVLEQAIGFPVVNLGCVNAGIDVVMNDETMMQICRDAALTVIQITGAQNLSNRFYTVHPRRNDRFLKASPALAELYPDMDFTEFHFTRHLLSRLQYRAPHSFAEVQQELRSSWIARMGQMMDGIGGRQILLWMGDRRPEDACHDWAARDPLFVDREMIGAVAGRSLGMAEVVAMPEEIEAGLPRMVHSQLEEPAAREMLGPVVHQAAARVLAEMVMPILH